MTMSLGLVVQKPINANPRLKINQQVYFSTSINLFSAYNRQKFTLEVVNIEKQKLAKVEKKMKPKFTLILG